jgi:predicted phage-related endonuclease
MVGQGYRPKHLENSLITKARFKMDRNEVNALFKEIAQYKLIEAEAKANREAAEAKVKALMEENDIDTLLGDEHKATWKEIVSNRFDSTAFKKDHADMYKTYQKESKSMRFTFA